MEIKTKVSFLQNKYAKQINPIGKQCWASSLGLTPQPRQIKI